MGVAPPEGDLPLPDPLDEMFSARVDRLPPAVRRVLLAVALSEDLRTDRLLAVVGGDALDDAVDAGAVVIDGQRVRAAHPLLAAAGEKRSRSRERRELHLALSEFATEEAARNSCTWRLPTRAGTAPWRCVWPPRPKRLVHAASVARRHCWQLTRCV